MTRPESTVTKYHILVVDTYSKIVYKNSDTLEHEPHRRGNMAHQTVNYIRVSSIDQNEARQNEALPRADETFTDKVSGSTVKRPALQSMLKHIRKGDHINVHSIDRLARNLEDLHKLVKAITGKGCTVTFHKENLTFGNGDSSSMSELLFNILGSFAQFERSMIRERQREGIAIAKAKGKKLGRPSTLTDEQREEIRAKRAAGTTPTQLSKEYCTSRANVYKICQSK